MLLQAALRVPDHEVVELTVMRKRWQMVLGCMGAEEPLFSQGTFFNFRHGHQPRTRSAGRCGTTSRRSREWLERTPK